MKHAALLLVGMLGSGLALWAQGSSAPGLEQLNSMIARYAPTPIRVNVSRLSPGDQKALVKLIEAARVLNPVFMNQLWDGGLGLYDELKTDATPLGRARLHYFRINKGPWGDMDEHKAFLPGVPARKLPGANFYPTDMSKEEFDSWLQGLDAPAREKATGFFTVIRREPGSRKLTMAPYSREYAPELAKAATLLREAAALTDNASLKKFLASRADAFLSDDYYQSDVDWMDLDAPLDITIGPYETYNDELFGYKAAFEAFINVRDEAETGKLAAFSRHLQEIEDHLPEDPQYRRPQLGASAPIRVVNQVFASGDADHGIKTIAYNLPNDERVVEQKGSKRVMLKNLQEAKFRSVLIPIAQHLLTPKQRADVTFEPFFTWVLAHELMHGLGPQQITVNGQATSPRQQLKELYSAIEEAKADVTGLFALQYMMDHAQEMGLSKVLRSGEAADRQLYASYLASAFRTLRFGFGDAHGKGMALQFNYLMDKGGFVQQPDGTFAVDYARIKPAVRDLTHELLTLEATGDYAATKRMMDEMVVIRPPVKRELAKLRDIPVDIDVEFATADELAPEPGAKPEPAAPAKKASRSRKRRK